VRAVGNSNGTAVFARGVTDSHAYQGGIDTNGEVYIGWNDAATRFHYLGATQTNLRPNQEDILLQFDVFDDELELFAWRTSDPMPTEPTVSVVDDQFEGPGLIFIMHHPNGMGSGAFRFVQATPTPIIPEPSSVALGSLGMITLACFMFRTRLNGVRSA
jgi:hypothetical protein